MPGQPKTRCRPKSATVSTRVGDSNKPRRSSLPLTDDRPPQAGPVQRAELMQEPPQNEYTTNNLLDLLNILHPVVSKWYYIGISLIGFEEVSIISHNHPGDVQGRFTGVIEKRLRQGPLSRLDLHEVLSSPIVGAEDLADRIFGPINLTMAEEDSTQAELRVTKNNVIHCIKPDVAETVFPYTQLKWNYNFTAFSFALFLFLQLLTIIDSHDWVRPRNYTVQQYTNRVVFFILYTLLMIVTPSVCYAQFCKLGSYEKYFFRSNDTTRIQINNATQVELNNIVTERKISLNPLEMISQFVAFLRLQIFEVDVKRFQVLMHAITLPLVLFSIRAFDDSNYDHVGSNNFRIGGERVVDIWENIAFMIIFFLSGTLKDVYCFENHIATILAEDEANRNSSNHVVSKKIFDAVRKRWVIMDVYTHFLSVVFAVLAVILFLYGKPFTPRYLLVENATEQHAWNVVTVLIILLQFGGSSANPVFKLLCTICYVAVPFIMCTVIYLDENVLNAELNIHLPRGNALLLIFASQLVSLINWLLCLFHSYWRQDNLSNVWYHLCLTAIILVFGCLVYTHVREFKYYIHDRTCSCNCTSFINGSLYEMIN